MCNYMRQLLTLTLILLLKVSIGQVHDSTIVNAYNRSICDYVQQKDSAHNYHDLYFICSFKTEHLVKKVTGRPIIYFPDSVSLYKSLKPSKKHHYRDIYTISDNMYQNKDTIDIRITKRIFLPKGEDFYICGGIITNCSNLPNGRLVFDKNSHSYRFISNDELKKQCQLEISK